MLRMASSVLSLGSAVFVFLVGAVLAQEASPPTLKYVMSYQADLLPPQVVGPNHLIWDAATAGQGWVKAADGSTGKIIHPSADWMEVLPNGTLRLDVRATVEMDDGSLIYVEYAGRLKLNEAGAAKWESGEELGDGDWYFVASPTARTASEKYAWMNDAVFVNKAVAVQGPNNAGKPLFVRYDVYMVVP